MKKRKTNLGKRAQPAAQPGASKALIPLDTARIADRHRKKLEKVRQDLETAQEQWRQYTEIERPAYERWVHLECGALIAELHQMKEEYDYKAFLLNEAHARSIFSGRSLRESLHDVQEEMKRDPARDEPPPDPDAGRDFSGSGRESDADDEADWEDFFSRLADEKPKRRSAFLEGARLRSLYRDICRQLHPDTGAAMNERTKQLWNEVQEAYGNKDLERLETLRALCDLEAGSLGKSTSCSRLLDLIKHFQKGLRSLKSLLKKARNNEPGYGFSTWDNAHKTRVKHDLQGELKEGVEHLKFELKELNYILKDLEREPASYQSSRRRARAAEPW